MLKVVLELKDFRDLRVAEEMLETKDFRVTSVLRDSKAPRDSRVSRVTLALVRWVFRATKEHRDSKAPKVSRDLRDFRGTKDLPEQLQDPPDLLDSPEKDLRDLKDPLDQVVVAEES